MRATRTKPHAPAISNSATPIVIDQAASPTTRIERAGRECEAQGAVARLGSRSGRALAVVTGVSARGARRRCRAAPSGRARRATGTRISEPTARPDEHGDQRGAAAAASSIVSPGRMLGTLRQRPAGDDGRDRHDRDGARVLEPAGCERARSPRRRRAPRRRPRRPRARLVSSCQSCSESNRTTTSAANGDAPRRPPRPRSRARGRPRRGRCVRCGPRRPRATRRRCTPCSRRRGRRRRSTSRLSQLVTRSPRALPGGTLPEAIAPTTAPSANGVMIDESANSPSTGRSSAQRRGLAPHDVADRAQHDPDRRDRERRRRASRRSRRTRRVARPARPSGRGSARRGSPPRPA